MTRSEPGQRTRLTRRRFLTAVGATAGIVACGPGAAPVAAETARPTIAPVTIKFASVSSGAVGFLTHVMTQRKIAAKYQITLDLVLADPAAAERAVLLKQVEAGLFPIVSAARANIEGQPITVFGPLLWSHNYGVTFADRPYARLADLKGKRIATLEAISGTYQATQIIAAGAGLNFERDFQVVTSPAPGVLALLARGDVEGIVHFEPNIGNLLVTGKYKVFLDHNAEWRRATGQNLFSIGLAAHQPWLDTNRETARRLVTALLETAALVQRDPTVFEEYAAFLGLDAPEKIKAAQERMPRIYPTEWNEAIAGNAEQIIAKAVELKLLDKAPPRRVTLVL